MAGYDYSQLNTTFGAICKLNGFQMVELNNNGRRPPLPFVAYDVISPAIPIGFQGQDDAHAFECVVSFTVYETNRVGALTRCSGLRSSFDAENVKDMLATAGIIVVDIKPTQIRYSQGANVTAALVGFDMQLRLKATPVPDGGTIDEVKLGGNYIGIHQD